MDPGPFVCCYLLQLLATPIALVEKIQILEEGTLIFSFYGGIVEGDVEGSGTLDLRNCFTF